MPPRQNRARNLRLEERFSVQWFTENLPRAAVVLRTLDASGGPKRNDFVKYLNGYIDEEPTEEEWDTLFKVGMPQTLLDIASQRQLYRDYLSDDLLPVS